MGAKTKTKTKIRLEDLPKDYAGLCGRLAPRPIHDAVDYSKVAEITEAMVLWQENLTTDQRDYFDLLCTLLEEYDSENVKWTKLKGREIRLHRCWQCVVPIR